MKLQRFIQEVATVLETTSSQVIRDMPRVVKSVDVVQQEVAALKERMGSVKRDLEKVERDTAQSMSLLLELDQVKTRMVETSSALQEADNWSSLSEDIDAAFQAGDLKVISSKLLGMQRSLMVLTEHDDFSDRKRRLEMLQDRFESLIQPKLEEAYLAHSVDAARELVVMLKDADREHQAVESYQRCHKNQMLQTWTELASDDSTKLPDALGSFYDMLEKLSVSEIEFCGVLFGDSAAVAELLVAVLQALEPSPAELMAADLEQGADRLDRVIVMYRRTTAFVAAAGFENEPLARLAFRQFAAIQADYGRLQARELRAQASFADLGGDATLEELVQLICSSVPGMFAEMEAATDRCVALTGGLGVSSLIQCLDEYSVGYFDRLCSSLPELRGQAEREANTARDASQELEEWSQTNSVFRLLEGCGTMFRCHVEFEARLRQAVLRADRELQLRGGPRDFTAGNAGLQAGYDSWHEKLKRSDQALTRAVARLRTFNDNVHLFALDTVLSPLRLKLAEVGDKAKWVADDDSGFSLSPLSYITQVGEQFLTLPQHLEPFLSDDDDSVELAFKHSKLASLTEATAAADGSGDSDERSVADDWLGIIATRTMESYVREIVKIKAMSRHGAKQLATDIDYVCNVLQALDVSASNDLQCCNQLLSVDADGFAATAAAAAADAPAIATAIKKMRKL